MPYRYLEDIATADVAFEARGKDLEELFTSAADATMNVMVADLASIAQLEKMDFEVENADLDMLLFNFLQEFIFFKDARRLLLRVLSVSIDKGNAGFSLQAKTAGEELDPEKHDLIVDVKAVTLYRFALQETESGWMATVVLDI
jgi:SHS2 domain-containing protein